MAGAHVNVPGAALTIAMLQMAQICNASDGTNLMLELFQYDNPWDNQLEIVEYWRQTLEDKGPVRICSPEKDRMT